MNRREAYQQKMEARLEEWQAELSKLKARAERASAEMRIEIQEQLGELRKKRDATAKSLEQLESASDAAWDDVKSGLEASWNDLKSSLDRAASRFKPPRSVEPWRLRCPLPDLRRVERRHGKGPRHRPEPPLGVISSSARDTPSSLRRGPLDTLRESVFLGAVTAAEELSLRGVARAGGDDEAISKTEPSSSARRVRCRRIQISPIPPPSPPSQGMKTTGAVTKGIPNP